MPPTLPQANEPRQEKLCCGEIDISATRADYSGMARERDLIEPTLYIGEWIAVLGLKPREIAKKAKVSEPYLNQLIHRKKENPSLKMLSKIANAIGISLRDLQMPPPPPDVLRAIQAIPAEQIERIRHRRKAS